MSTKSTLARGDLGNCHFHFYSEAGCDGEVYLDLNFRNGKNYHGELITIPIEVWEVIREKTVWQNGLVGLTDGDLRMKAHEYVDKRDNDVREIVAARMKKGDSRKAAKKAAAFFGMMGCLNYGLHSDPFPVQYRKGIASLKKWRDYQEEGQKKIDALKKANEDCPGVFVIDLKKRKGKKR